MIQWSLGAALYERGDLDAARAALERAAALAPMAQGDTSPRALLAAIAEKQGDAARARDELRHLLEWDHDNVEAARRLVTSARAADRRVASRGTVGIRVKHLEASVSAHIII